MTGSGSFTSIDDVDDRSAVPRTADIGERGWHVAVVPRGDICSAANCSLFDHLVGAGEQGRWYVEAERLCGLEINH
jgi:hypothetical protein